MASDLGGSTGYIVPQRSRVSFAIHLLLGLGRSPAHATDDITRFVVAWITEEGMSASTNNPLATTMRAAGSTPLPGNTAGVQQFKSLDDAMALAIRNLKTPLYAKLTAELVHGNPSTAARELQASGWCGGPRSPCPGYGGKVIALYATFTASDTAYKVAALKASGTTDITVGLDAGQAESDIEELKRRDPGGIVSAVTSTADVIDALGTALGWISTAANLKRVGLVAGGLVLALVGLALVKHDTLGQAAKAVAGAAVLA